MLVSIATYIGFVAFQSSVPCLDYEINADSIYLFMITRDVVFDGGRLAEWSISAHLYLFPDVPLTMGGLLLQRAGLSVFTGSVAIYGVMLGILAAAIWRRTTAAPVGQSILAGMLLVSIIYCGAYLLYVSAIRDMPKPDTLIALDHVYSLGQILGPALHSGAFIMACGLFMPVYSFMTRSPVVKLPSKVLTPLTWIRESWSEQADRPPCSGPTAGNTSMPTSVGTEGIGGSAPCRWVSDRGAVFLAMLVAFGVFLTTLSDIIFVAWGVLPLSIATLTLTVRGLFRRGLVLLALIWSTMALGYLASWLIGDEFRSAYFNGTRVSFAVAFAGLVSFAKLIVSLSQPVITLFCVANLILWTALLRCLWLEARLPSASFGRAFTIFAASMSVGSIFAAVATGLFSGDQIRYFIPYIVLGPGFCVFMAMVQLSRHLTVPRWAVTSSGSGIAIFLTGVIGGYSLPGPAAEVLAKCLKQDGLVSGRANYWDASPVVAASGWRIQAIPLAPGGLDVFSWLTSKRHLHRTKGIGQPDRSFLILDPSTVPIALNRYGPANSVLKCAERRVLVYKGVPW